MGVAFFVWNCVATTDATKLEHMKENVQPFATIDFSKYCDNLLEQLHLLTLHGRHEALSAVGIATSHGLHHRGVEVRVLAGSRTGSGVHRTPVQWVPGAFSPKPKRQGREAKHSLPTRAEVYTCTSPYAFMA